MLAHGILSQMQYATVAPAQPTIDQTDLIMWFDAGNPACYDGSNPTLNNLVTGGSFDTATQVIGNGSNTITLDATGRSMTFTNNVATSTNTGYRFDNRGPIDVTNGITWWAFFRRDSLVGASRWAGCFFQINNFGTNTLTNFLIDTNNSEKIRAELQNPGVSAVSTFAEDTYSVDTWVFVAVSQQYSQTGTFTYLQVNETVYTQTYDYNNMTTYTPTEFTTTGGQEGAGFGIGGPTTNTMKWSLGALGYYERALTSSEMLAIKSTYQDAGYYV